MTDAEYCELDAAKRAAAAMHEAGKRLVRERIAAAILKAPGFAVEQATGALENKTAAWQQWSRSAWKEILRTKTPIEIATMLVNPAGVHEQNLADSHPFGGLTAELEKRFTTLD